MSTIIFRFVTLALAGLIATSCGTSTRRDDTLVFGFSPGPYSDLFKLGIQPELETRGYTIRIVEFTDWVTPNIALANREIDANIFQHSRYLAQFCRDKGLELSPVISIPTASMGLYSRKIDARNIDQLKSALTPGCQIAIPHDPTNLARALIFLREAGLVTLRAEIDPTKASEKDIADNPYGLRFVAVDAAQLPRTLQSVDLAVISGNYAISAGIRLSTAIAGERLTPDTENVIAVRTEDLDRPFVEALREIVRSEAFRDLAENPQYDFASFQRPAWYAEQWGIANR